MSYIHFLSGKKKIDLILFTEKLVTKWFKNIVCLDVLLDDWPETERQKNAIS